MELITYRPLFLLLLLILLAVIFKYSLVNRKQLLKLCSFFLRLAGITALILALCRPFFITAISKKHQVYLMDVSESVDLDSVQDALKKVEHMIGKLRPGDSYSLFYFADGLRKTSVKELREKIKQWQEGTGNPDFRKKTRIASSLQTACLAFPANKVKTTFLFSDGINTTGKLKPVLEAMKQDDIELFFSQVEKVKFPEAAVVATKAYPQVVYYGEKIKLTAELFSNQDMKARLRIVNRGVVVKEIPVELKKDRKIPVTVEVTVNQEGSSRWITEIIPEKDHFPENNKSACTVEIKGRIKILAIHNKPVKLKQFAAALKKQDIEVDYRNKMGLPEHLGEMLEFDAVLLADVPASDISTRQMQALRRYVTEFGRLLMMTGSENSFGLGGYYKTPVEEVLPLVSRYEKEKEQPSMAMVLVIDKSGSMNGEPIALAKMASKAAVELLSPRDQVGVVAFDGDAFIVCDMTSAVHANDIASSIDNISAGGGTNMYPAMAAGKDMLAKSHTKIKHMIILSDGQSTPGDFEGVASEMADLAMTVSTVALGGADRELMARIAEIGRGRYYETGDAESVPRIFTKETIEASKSAIKEEPFAPVKLAEMDWMQGINFDSIPFLLGYVMTRMKPAARIQLLTEHGDPLLATGRFGLGNSMAFTSDITGRWSGEWVEWRNFGKFWSQLIRSLLQERDSEGFRIIRKEEDNEVKITVWRHDDSGRELNGIKWDAALIPRFGSIKKIKVREVGFGRYDLTFKKPMTSNYSIRLNDLSNNKMKVVYFNSNYPCEYNLSSKLAPEIGSITLLGNDYAADYRRLVKSGKPIGNYMSLLGILCMLGGILLRRI